MKLDFYQDCASISISTEIQSRLVAGLHRRCPQTRTSESPCGLQEFPRMSCVLPISVRFRKSGTSFAEKEGADP